MMHEYDRSELLRSLVYECSRLLIHYVSWRLVLLCPQDWATIAHTATAMDEVKLQQQGQRCRP